METANQKPPTWRGQRVAVLGFGREGQAMVNYILTKGAAVTICDEKEDFRRDDVATTWRGRGIEWQLGPSYLKGFDKF